MSPSCCSCWVQQWSTRPGAADGADCSLRHEAIIRTSGKQPSQRQQQRPEALASQPSSPQGLLQLGREDPRLEDFPGSLHDKQQHSHQPHPATAGSGALSTGLREPELAGQWWLRLCQSEGWWVPLPLPT